MSRDWPELCKEQFEDFGDAIDERTKHTARGLIDNLWLHGFLSGPDGVSCSERILTLCWSTGEKEFEYRIWGNNVWVTFN